MQHTPVNQRERNHPFETPEEYEGYQVCDPLGQEIGCAEELLVNGANEPEYVKVGIRSSGFKSVVIPVHLIAVDECRQRLILR